MSKERAPGNGFILKNWHSFGEALVSGRYDIRISNAARERLMALRDFLAQPEEHGRSVILYFNHQAYNDPILAWRAAQLIDPERTRQLFAPTSSWASKVRFKNALYLAMVAASKMGGVRVTPIVQAYQVDNPDYGYTELDAKASYRKLLRTTSKLRQQGPVFCLISPEGTRTAQNGSLRAEVFEGVLKLGQILAPTVYAPLAITFPEGYERDSLNFGRQVGLDMGEWTIQNGRFDGPTIEKLMDNLADALPPRMRGNWGTSPQEPEPAE